MRLITVERFLEKYSESGSRPRERTLKRWIRQGTIPARKVGGTWYVDEHRWLANGNPLVLRVIEASPDYNWGG